MNPLLQILPDSIYHNVVHYLDNEIHIGNICIANQTIGVVLPLRIKRKKVCRFCTTHLFSDSLTKDSK